MNTVELDLRQSDGGARIAHIRLNRPDARNALNNQMCLDLLTALRQVEAEPEVACVVIAGKGPAFCAGADLKERQGMDDDQIRGRRLRAFRAYDAVETLSMPAIAAVAGPCVGSGCEIATACDFIVAAEGATFRYPEAQWGTVGATQRLPRIVGKRLAKELMFTGRPVPAEEALRIGLVNRVVAETALEAEVETLVGQIVKAPLAALKQAKRCIDQGTADSRMGALAEEILAIEENLEQQAWRDRMVESPAK
ncbi:MAG: enoyl-CoA hydratase [Kiloniellaceae bacterium]